MKRSMIQQLYKDYSSLDGQTVKLAGWVRSLRDSKHLAFIELTDGSVIKSVQLVVDASIEGFEKIVKLGTGASLQCVGKLMVTPEARQPFEITATSIEIEGDSPSDYPLQKKRHSLEYLRSIPHLRPRTNTFQAVFRVRSEIAYAIHEFFHQQGVLYVHTPLVTGSDAEGAGEMFRVTTLDPGDPPRLPDGTVAYSKDFFGQASHLTVSGQLEAEAFAQAFSNVYTFGPTFRAEKSNTPRHAAEFWMIEPEFSFCDLQGDMDYAEGLIKHIIGHLLDTCPYEMEFFNQFIDKTLLKRLQFVCDTPFERMTYTRAIELLEPVKDRFQYPVYWGCDLQTEHERYVSEEICKKPVFLTDYPKEIKSFYMRLNDDGKTVAAMDLLVPAVGELVGGSQREERYDLLLERMKADNMDMDAYDWYLGLRRYGNTRHAGFGLGFDRITMYVTGMANIRDVIPFPRTTGTL